MKKYRTRSSFQTINVTAYILDFSLIVSHLEYKREIRKQRKDRRRRRKEKEEKLGFIFLFYCFGVVVSLAIENKDKKL